MLCVHEYEGVCVCERVCVCMCECVRVFMWLQLGSSGRKGISSEMFT